MDSNPNEVISILIVNVDSQPVASFAAAYTTASLVDISYAPKTIAVTVDYWPTLGTLIDRGKRIVSFIDSGADVSAAPYLNDGTPPLACCLFSAENSAWHYRILEHLGNRVRRNRTHFLLHTQPYRQHRRRKMGLPNHFLDKPGRVPGNGEESLVSDKEQMDTTDAASGPGSLGEKPRRV